MKTDWVFIFKAVFACLLSMGIAMRLEIDQPRIAMLTVMVVMQPQSGMVVGKSIYRMIGTLAGCIASLLFFSLFSQQRELLLLALALWVGICTAGAARYRNHAPYGFVLAGYTACIVMFPIVETPLRVFEVAIDRLAVVSIGVFCAGAVSAVIFPQSSARLMLQATDQQFTHFITFVHDAFTGRLDEHNLRDGHLRFTADVVRFESFRSGATFEDPHILADSSRLRRLNEEFMHATSRFHALTSLMARMRSQYYVHGALQYLTSDIAGILAPEGKIPENPEETQRVLAHLERLKDKLLLGARRWRAVLEKKEPAEVLRDYDTATELLFRFLGDLHGYISAHASLGEPKEDSNSSREALRYIPKTDGAAALMSGARAMLTVLILGTFWIISRWPSGYSACVFGACSAALCAIAPKPQRAARHAVLAGIMVVCAAFTCDYLIMPHIDGFWLLCLILTPFLMIGPWLQLKPNWVGAGSIYNLFFSFVAGPTNLMHYNPAQFLNYMISLLVGFSVAAASYLVLIPPDSEWLMRRRMRNLRRLAVKACLAPLKGLAAYFESATRDMIHYMAVGQWEAPTRRQELLDCAFPVMEVGHAVLELREEMESPNFPPSLKPTYHDALTQTAELFERPDAYRAGMVLNIVDKALSETEALEDYAALPARHALRHAQSYLHFIRAALVDMEPLYSPRSVHAA